MDSLAELSAFEAYNKRKTERKRKRKEKKKQNENILKEPGVTESSKRLADELDEKTDLLFTDFVKDMHVKKKRRKDTISSTPLEGLFENSASTSASNNDNIFLNSKKKGKKKKDVKDDSGLYEQQTEEGRSELINKSRLKKGKVPVEKNINSVKPKKKENVIKENGLAKSMICENTFTLFPNKENQVHSASTLGKTSKSFAKAQEVLAWMISPIEIEKFFADYWESKPLHITRSTPEYYEDLCSSQDLNLAFQYQNVYFGKNVDVTAYENNVRTTENPEGRARPAIVRELLKKGRSIRVLNPQTFIPNVGKLVSSLQEYFNCMVGVNSYLTPAGTQGFAPHYDDIEAFVLQLEGEKLWKVYSPRSEYEVLPSYSSPNFSQDEIGEPILEVLLKPGDMLYFPRGFIHQARSVENHHSLHITVSTYQRNSWADFLEKALPAAIEKAKEEMVELREGLPLNFLNNLGLVHSESESPERLQIIEKLNTISNKVLECVPWDAAADQIGKQFLHDSYPPCISVIDEDMAQRWFESSDFMNARVKLITGNCIRLLSEEDSLFVYYNTDNSQEYHGEDPQKFEITPEAGPIVEALIKNYPKFMKVKKFVINEFEEFADANLVKETLSLLISRSLVLLKGL